MRTPLRLPRIGDVSVQRDTYLRYQFPKATGGTPPYTYALAWTVHSGRTTFTFPADRYPGDLEPTFDAENVTVTFPVFSTSLVTGILSVNDSGDDSNASRFRFLSTPHRERSGRFIAGKDPTVNMPLIQGLTVPANTYVTLKLNIKSEDARVPFTVYLDHTFIEEAPRVTSFRDLPIVGNCFAF